ncbi:MAG: hypothetical protein WCH62_02610 [Candidatus Omnitrophota bacterium]
MKKADLHWSLWAILFLEYLYIFLILLNYDLAWINPEKVSSHAWILGNGSGFRWEDIIRSFNTGVIEIDQDRFSRPISNLVEVFDTKFRSICWNFFPPHPSFSFLWFLSFICLPFFLYRFFINMGCSLPIAFSGMCLYLSSIGFLGPIVMLFHPAKGLVNLLGVGSLCIASSLYKKSITLGHGGSIKDIPGFWKWFILLLGVMFLAFFSDETGLFIYPLNLIVLFPLIKKVKERRILWICFLLLPVVYLITLSWLLPLIHLILRNEVVNLFHYRATPHFSVSFRAFCNNFWVNVWWLFSDYPHLLLNTKNLLACWPILVLRLVYSAIIVFIGYLFFKRKSFCKFDFLTSRFFLFSGLLIAYVVFQTILLSAEIQAWGVWWYGNLFCLIYFIIFTFILQKAWEAKNKTFQKFFVLIIFVFVLEGLIYSTYRIAVFKRQNHDFKNYPIADIFNGTINPYTRFNFTDSLQKSRCAYIYTLLKWSDIKHKRMPLVDPSEIQQCRSLLARLDRDASFPWEVLYLPVDLEQKDRTVCVWKEVRKSRGEHPIYIESEMVGNINKVFVFLWYSSK